MLCSVKEEIGDIATTYSLQDTVVLQDEARCSSGHISYFTLNKATQDLLPNLHVVFSMDAPHLNFHYSTV